MNRYLFSELSIGMSECFEAIVTEDMMNSFCNITGDINPLHNDRDYAISKGFPDRVCYGMLTASLLSTFAGVYLPGEHCLIHEVDSKFVKPVFAGDHLKVSGEITELNDTFQQATMKVAITNQKGEKVLRAKMKVGFTHER